MAMRTPLLYRISRTVIRLSVSLYFRKLEISGRRNAPREGPVIFAANHPQSVTDALVLGLTTGRMISYLAHSGLFRSKVKRAFLQNCGVIPVYRPHEVADAGDKNVDMFSACYELLEKGGAIGIFPEGTSAEERRVQKLKTGAARIALQAESMNNWTLGLTIIPVGINFQSRRRFRSRVLVSFGLPIAVARFRPTYEDDAVEAVHDLTNLMEKSIRARVVNITRAEFSEFIGDVEKVYKEELLARDDGAVAGGTKFKRGQNVSQEIPRALDFFLEHKPEVIWRIRTHLSDYLSRLRDFRITDEQLRNEPPSVIGAAMRMLSLAALSLPFAVWGAVWNFIPYKLTGILAKRAAADLTKLHFQQLMFGVPLYLAYYVPLLFFAQRHLGWLGAAVFAVSLIPTGFLARSYVGLISRRRQMLRLALLRVTKGIQVKQLRQLRKDVIAEMDSALELYLSEIARGQRT